MEEMSFWDHLEALRGVIFRSLGAVVVLAVVFFVFMTDIFDSIILAPCFSDFVLYRSICNLSTYLSSISEYLSVLPDFCGDDFHVNLINIQLASQFFIHMSTSFWLAIVFAFPYIIYQLWSFVSPGLYEREKKECEVCFYYRQFDVLYRCCSRIFACFSADITFLSRLSG